MVNVRLLPILKVSMVNVQTTTKVWWIQVTMRKTLLSAASTKTTIHWTAFVQWTACVKKKKNSQCVRDNTAILHLVALIAVLNLSVLLFKAYHITLPSFSEAPALLVQCAWAWRSSNLALFIGSKLLKLYKFYCFKATAAPCCTVHCWLCSPLKHRCLQTQPTARLCASRVYRALFVAHSWTLWGHPQDCVLECLWKDGEGHCPTILSVCACHALPSHVHN